mgnify:CR=1 FL=1
MTEKLWFSGINYDVCIYCKNMAIGYAKDDVSYGCALQKSSKIPGWEYKTLGYGINGSLGCEKFESSGLPVHPKVLEKLIASKELIKKIPVSEKATETSWELYDKLIKFSHKSMKFNYGVNHD